MQTRLLAIFAALVAATALIVGCSSKSQDSSKELPDAATLIKESSQTTKSQTSVHLKLNVQGQIHDMPIESL
jgi:lipoprotein LprG